MKIIDNHNEFLEELRKGNKRIGVTEKFYNWLRENIKQTTIKSNSPPINPFCEVEVYVEKDELKDSDIK